MDLILTMHRPQPVDPKPNLVPVRRKKTPRTGLRVLVVEDCPDSALSMSLLLDLWGHTPEMAADGFAALEQCALAPPDVLLLDIGLPGLNGWDVLQELRQRDLLRKTTVVMLSGYLSDRQGQGAELGFQYFLTKPVEPAFLEKFLNQIQHGGRVDAGA